MEIPHNDSLSRRVALLLKEKEELKRLVHLLKEEQ